MLNTGPWTLLIELYQSSLELVCAQHDNTLCYSYVWCELESDIAQFRRLMTYWNTVVIILMIYMYILCGLYYKHCFATIVGRKSCPPPLDSPDPSIPAAQSTVKIQVTLPTESKYRDCRVDDPAYPNIVSETNAQLDLTAQPVIQGSSKHPLGESSPYDSSPKVASTGAIPGGNISLKFDSEAESPHPGIYSYVFDTNEDEVPMFFNAIPKECGVNFDPHTPQ